jgi:SNF2 domain-containing protein/SNF2 helicase protein/helicase-like protein
VIVVHGWWSLPPTPAANGDLVLWAEDALGPAEGMHRAGRRPKVRDHPFALDAEQLAKVLGLTEAPEPAADGGAVALSTADLALPGFTNAPSASPELLDLRSLSQQQVAVGETIRLHPGVRWRVPTVSVPAAQAMRTLAALAVDPAEPGDPDTITVLAGSDVRQLQRLAGFAADLVGRGRTLPVVLADGGRAVARWRPVLTGSDAEWFRSAVAALPPAYGAAFTASTKPTTSTKPSTKPTTSTKPSTKPTVASAGTTASTRPAAASAVAALDALVDAVVRERIPPPTRPDRPQPGLAGWRRALRGNDPFFQATTQQLTELTQALTHWQADAVGGSAVRACFRLVEPRDDDEASVLRRPTEPARSAAESAHWWLEFGLQVVDQPSLFVPAEQIWSGQPPLTVLTRHTPRPQEQLLAELGRALRLYPLLGRALAGPRPAELALDTEAAHAFLAEVAPLLIGAGFGVQLPGWWTSPKARLGARLRAGTPTQPGRVDGRPALGQDGLVDFDWRLSIGTDLLTEEEIETLIETQSPLVRVRGEWLQVDPERLRKARDFLRRKNSDSGMTVAAVLHVLGSADEGPGGLPVTGVDAEGWLGELLAPATEQRLQPVAVPEGFRGTLRPYQERGVAWLAFLESIGMGAVLADDMGLGKTVQLLALIAHDLEKPEAAGPTLLVCPMSLVGNWERETAKFTPQLRVHVQHGKERPQGKEFRAAVLASDLVITTYSLLARDSAALRKLPWRRVVLDEAQAVKNAATQAAIAARALKAPRRIAVTGTPVENRLADLWSLMEFANPKLLGDAADFKRRFALPIERAGSTEASARLRNLTQPFVLRRVKTDTSIISDLPEKLEMEVICTLTGEQAALYQSVVEDMLERIANSSGIERRGLVLATMTKLKQVCNHPAQFLRDGSRIGGRSGKLARLEETLDEVLAAGEKALLFTQYAEFGELLRTHLTATFGREVAFLHGGLSKAQRDAMVARFQHEERQGPALFVLSLKAGGTGLTLTAANHVIHVDRWWNPAVEDQATDRAFRIGQSRAVQVRKFVCAGTLEEKISLMIRDKRGLAASVVGTGEGWLTELSTSQLRELLTLDAESVVS